VPGAGYVEMILAAASAYYDTDKVEIRDMDIVRALELFDDQLVETHTEISPDSSSVRIYSRTRLSEDEWTLNASARIAKIPSEELGVEEISPAPSGTILAQADALYPLAKTTANEKVELGPYGSNLLLNPTDLDVAFHGLVALYQELEDKEIKRGYIPIRFGKLRIFKAYEGVLIASLQDARFRAASLVKRQKLEQYTYHFSERRHPHPEDLNGLQGPHLRVEPIAPLQNSFLNGDWDGSEPRLLLEAAAQRIAFDAASFLADDGTLSFSALQERGKISPDDEVRLSAFLTVLENAGFAQTDVDAGTWRISQNIDLPETEAILSTVLNSFPDWAAECVMLSHIANHVERKGVVGIEDASAFEAATLEQY